MSRVLILLLLLSGTCLAGVEEDKEHMPKAQTPEPTPIGLRMFIRAVGIDPDGYSKYELVLDKVSKIAKFKLVLEYPTTSDIRNATGAPGITCTIVASVNAALATLSTEMTCTPELNGNARLLRWSMLPPVGLGDFKIVNCFINDEPSPCWLDNLAKGEEK